MQLSSQKTLTLKFKSKKIFNSDFKDYFILEDYISKHKPNGDITSVFFNQDDELVIKTDNPAKIEYLRTWPDDAFEHGLIEVTKKNKFYLALHNVDTNFNIESTRSKMHLSETYQIDDVIRMVKKSTGQKLTVVKAVTGNKDKFNELTSTGYIKIGFSRIRISAWKFEPRPDQCFNCQKFGHLASKCPSKIPVCLRCNGSHSHKNCKINDPKEYLCANCGGKHAACSKTCPELIKATQEKEKKVIAKISNQSNQTIKRVESSQQKLNQTYNPVNLIKFIIDLVKNLRGVTSSIHTDPRPLLKMINQNFGAQITNQIEQVLTTEPIEQDPFMSNIMEHENEQD